MLIIAILLRIITFRRIQNSDIEYLSTHLVWVILKTSYAFHNSKLDPMF